MPHLHYIGTPPAIPTLSAHPDPVRRELELARDTRLCLQVRGMAALWHREALQRQWLAPMPHYPNYLTLTAAGRTALASPVNLSH